MANGQTKVVFWDADTRVGELNRLAEKERRTKTTLLHEALDLLFASRQKPTPNQSDEEYDEPAIKLP